MAASLTLVFPRRPHAPGTGSNACGSVRTRISCCSGGSLPNPRRANQAWRTPCPGPESRDGPCASAHLPLAGGERPVRNHRGHGSPSGDCGYHALKHASSRCPSRPTILSTVTLTGRHVQLVPLSIDHYVELVAAVQEAKWRCEP